MDPAMPTGSLLALKALATLEGSTIFDCLDPSTDTQAFRSLRLTCAELRQLVDCFGTQTLRIKLLDSDYTHDMESSSRLIYSQLREAGIALGFYHARLTGPVRPRKLCINAKTCCTCPARDEHGDAGVGANVMAAYMAGYVSVAGVPAVLARVTECCLAGDFEYGSVPREVWYALVPHLTSLTHLTLRFSGKAAPLGKAHMLAMLPPSAELRTLSIEEGVCVDLDARSCFLRCAAAVLKHHPIEELRLLIRSQQPGAKALFALSDALPSLERLRVTQCKPDDGMTAATFRWFLPRNTFPMLRSISYQPYSNTHRPELLLSQLDELLQDRPSLLHVGALDVLLTDACLAKQARYEHVERAQSASAADGGLGQLSFSLVLGDAWGGMQLQALPFTVGGVGGVGGQRAASAWSSDGSHSVHVWRGMESALVALAALLRPEPTSQPCARVGTPPEEFLILTYT